MRKRTFCFILTALLLVGFFAHSTIISAVFSWYLKGYCHSCLGGNLAFESLRKENGVWIIEKPTLATNENLSEGGHRFEAERAEINVIPSWFQRQIAFDISLEKPKIDVGQKAEILKELFHLPSQQFQLLNVHTRFFIPEGKMLLHDFSGGEPIAAPLFFSIDLACREFQEGCVSLWFEEEVDKDQAKLLKILFSSSDQLTPQISIIADEIDCPALSMAVRSIWPDWLPCELQNGSVKGEAVITLPQHFCAFADGQFIIQDLDVRYPLYELSSQIPEMTLTLSSKHSGRPHPNTILTTAHVDIPKNGRITFSKDNEAAWSIEALGGMLAYRSDSVAKFTIEACCLDQDTSSKLSLDGNVHLDEENQSSITLELSLSGEKPADGAAAHFALRQLGEHWNFAEVRLESFGKREFDFFQNIFGRVHPQWKQVDLYDGIVDAAMLVYLQGLKIAEVKIENFAAHHLDVELSAWELSMGVANVTGSLSLDFSAPDPLSTMDADLKIENGRLCSAGVDEAKWQLDNIHTDLAMRKGIIQKSLVKGVVAGLKGEIELDGNSNSAVIQCQFAGKAVDLAKALPTCIREGIQNKFSGDTLQISAGLERHPEGLAGKGKIVAGGQEVDFGFLLEKASGFTINKGWFEGQSLCLDKFISPFIFLKNQMRLSGTGDFHGTFDVHRVAVHYEAQDMVVENSDFAIEVKSIGVAPDKYGSQLSASHLFDIDKMHSSGTLPIVNGTYFEKNSGLLFTDINAAMSIHDDKAHFSNLETFCNGLYFAGAIDLDWSMPGEGLFEVDILTQEMQGKVSQVQHFFSHFNKASSFVKLPVEGNVAFRKEGGHMHFSFFPGDYLFNTTLHGAVSDGALSCEGGEISLQELCMNFDYDHTASTLEFSDIQGTILLGKPGHVEEYAIAGDYFRFLNYARNESVFDLWAGDKKRDLVRLVGKTFPANLGDSSDTICVQLDNALSHFSDVHPQDFQLELNNWFQVNSFHLKFNFDLRTLMRDLQRFHRSGFFFLSRSMLNELNELKEANGIFKVDFGYDGNRALLTYRAEGVDVSMGPYQFHECLLSGKKKGSTWTIDQLQLDNISLAADILKDDEVWKVNFLGARFGKSLLLGLEGEYCHNKSMLNAKINLLEADFCSFHEWPLLNKTLQELGLTGVMRGTGKVQLEFDKRRPQKMVWDVHMNIAFRSGKFRGFLLDDFENATIHYVSDKGLAIHNVNAALKSDDDVVTRATLLLQHANFNFAQRELIIDGLSFHIPVENLGWAAENLRRSFPDFVSQPLAEIIRCAKKEGELNGSIKVEFSQPHCALSLALEDGIYQLMNCEHNVSGFVLEYDPFELKISSRYRFQKESFWLTARSPVPALDSGDVVLSSLLFDKVGNEEGLPLTIHWRNDPQKGFFIKKMEGYLCGLNLNLIMDESQPHSQDQIYLIGAVNADLSKAHVLLSEELSTQCRESKLGSGYSLNGCWIVSKNKKPSESLAFRGELSGREFECLGYQFYEMTAQLAYDRDGVHATHITINDPCGSVVVDEMMITKNPDGRRSVFIPQMAMSDFRPCQLGSKDALSSRFPKTLIIRQLEMKDCCGIVGDRNSFIGTGRLTFANPPKKNLQHTIFAIPAEILTRLGLDLAVLTPVRGSIFYNIKDGKIILTRFKDVYSKGRVSKFYLPNTGFQSYADFDGNLNVQVRMKQYNIFFKLAELFTVTVQGTIQKPVYSLQKQPKQERI